MVYFAYVWVMGITLVSAHGNLFTCKGKFFYVEYLVVRGPGFTNEILESLRGIMSTQSCLRQVFEKENKCKWNEGRRGNEFQLML